MNKIDVAHADPEQPLRTELGERPGYLIRRLHQIHVALFLEECGADVTPVQYGVMTVLFNQPGMDQISLAAEVGIDRTNVADVVRRLESRGLVSRGPHPEDRRAKLVSLAVKGRQLTQRMFPAMQRAQDRLVEVLSETERARFMATLERLIEANNAYGRALLRMD